MSQNIFSIKFWGTRGSIPAPGPKTVKYGGNTACIEVRYGNELLILDAGTGINGLGTELSNGHPINGSILFSHTHWDHIQGMPFFRPAYNPWNHFRLYGNKNWDITLKDALRIQMRRPNFPVNLDDIGLEGAKIGFINIGVGESFQVGFRDKATVTSFELHHTDQAIGFRIDYMGRSIVYATDNEGIDPDDKVIKVAQEADILIHDAQYSYEEYFGLNGNFKKGFGHSIPENAAKTALAARVKLLVMFHHDPYHDDKTVDEMLEATSRIFSKTIAASEGLKLYL